ncbi:MAG TPA: molybdenum cofactor biosynthesis protein MoaE [Polyangiaceae bacterium]|nr:molybdenum cofactor biosynthesis protein MoaE [Polyangiaceae bacterium]
MKAPRQPLPSVPPPTERSSDPAPAGARDVELSAAPLVLDRVISAVSHAGAGAVATFIGAVRETNDGHAVTLLEYEAYPSLALAEMRRILGEIEHEMPGVRVAVHHRTGQLEVGAVAVVCAASAPHREEAFVACRLVIDRVKARVPIWKREHGPDGPYWVGWEDARCEPGHEHGHDHGPHKS